MKQMVIYVRNFVYFALLVVFVFLLCLLMGKVMGCSFVESNSHLKELTISHILTGLFAFATLFVSWNEYSLKVKREQITILKELDKEYCDNNDFQEVVKELRNCPYNCRDKQKILVNEVANVEKLPNREMFMRFFEKLQYQIEAGSIPKKQTHDLFGYYAYEIAKLGKDFVPDYDDDCWKTFRKFVEQGKYPLLDE